MQKVTKLNIRIKLSQEKLTQKETKRRLTEFFMLLWEIDKENNEKAGINGHLRKEYNE